jgi:transcriptional regulator with XRE-family HTH domain
MLSMAKKKETKPKELKALAKAVRLLREKANLSQEDLADRAEIDRTYVSGIERGMRNPSLRVLIRVADGLGVTLATLAKNIEQSR